MATFSLDTTQLKLGGQTHLQMTFEYPLAGAESVIWPTEMDTLCAGIEILQSGSVDTLPSNIDNHLKLSQRFLITSFDTGLVVIPPFTVLFNDSIIESNPLLLTMISPQVSEDTELYDIADIREVPLNFWDWLKANYLYILGVIVLLVAGWLIIRFTKQRKPVPSAAVAATKEEQLPAHIIALAALRDLKEKQKWQRGLVKEYHSELTDIIRLYVLNRFGIAALELTTGELVRELRNYGLPQETVAVLQRSFSLSDATKFAKYKPLPDENEGCMKWLNEFVERTAEVEQR
jgi:hypothetical protein